MTEVMLDYTKSILERVSFNPELFKRELQKALAEELTVRVHAKEDLEMALKATEIFFGNGSKDDLLSLNEETLTSSLDGLEKFVIAKGDFTEGIGILDFLATNTQIFASKGEARKMIQANGFSINKEKFTDVNGIIDASYLLHGKFILAQKGKKQYYVIVIV